MAQLKDTNSDRNICTFYFTDATKNFVIKHIWSKYSRSAVQRAVDRMTMNDLGATVAVVYDDDHGRDHAHIVRDVQGNVTVVYKRSPVTPLVAGASGDQFGEFAMRKSTLKIRPVSDAVRKALKIKRVKE